MNNNIYRALGKVALFVGGNTSLYHAFKYICIRYLVTTKSYIATNEIGFSSKIISATKNSITTRAIITDVSNNVIGRSEIQKCVSIENDSTVGVSSINEQKIEQTSDIHTKKSIETISEDPCKDCILNNTADKCDAHIIICNQDTWPKRIEAEEGSLAYIINTEIRKVKLLNKKIKLTACDMSSRSNDSTDIIIYPHNIMIAIPKNNETETVTNVINQIVNNDRILNNAMTLPWNKLILVCIHASRDAKCGSMGPLIISRMNQALESRNVTDVIVRGSSHIGGHKFAGIVIVYPEADWYGCITSDNSEHFIDVILHNDTSDKNSSSSSTRLKELEKCYRGKGLNDW